MQSEVLKRCPDSTGHCTACHESATIQLEKYSAKTKHLNAYLLHRRSAF